MKRFSPFNYDFPVANSLSLGREDFKNDFINQLSADVRGMEYLEGILNVQEMLVGKQLFRIFRE